MTDTLNPHKVKALELAVQAGGAHAEIVARAGAYHAFLTGTAAAPAGAAGASTGAKTPAADKGANAAPAGGTTGAKTPAAEKPAGGKGATADPKAGAGTPAGKGATADPKAGAGKGPDPKANGATAPKPAAAKAATPPSAQSIPADTKAPGGKNTYADVVAMLHKVQNGPAGRPECFKILLEDGGGAKSVRDLKPAFYDAVVEACTNVIADDGAGSAEAADESDPLGELGAAAGGQERDDMGL